MVENEDSLEPILSNKDSKTVISPSKTESSHKYPLSFQHETFLLLDREILKIRRNIPLLVFKLVQFAFLSLIFSVFFNQIGACESLVEYVGNFGGLFYNNTVNFFVNALFLVITSSDELKETFVKEQKGQMYRVESFYVAATIVFMIHGLIVSLVIGVVMYYSLGLYTDLYYLSLYLGMFMVLYAQGMTFGLALVSHFTEKISTIVGPTLFVIFMLGSGFFRSNDSFKWHNKWMNISSPFKYDIELLIRIFEGYNEMTGRIREEMFYYSGVETCFKAIGLFIGFTWLIGLRGFYKMKP